MVNYLLQPERVEHGDRARRRSSAALEIAVRPARHPAVRLADLRALHRPRLSHADLRRAPRRPRARPPPHRGHRRAPDGDRPFHDGVRAAAACSRSLFLILGNGAFKPNMSTQVGELYPPGDPRRDRAYSIFYVGINLGAFLAPLVCGTLGETRRLALRLRGRRRRHADRARDLSLRVAACCRPTASRRVGEQHAADARRAARTLVALC